jgi:hypothetical protein
MNYPAASYGVSKENWIPAFAGMTNGAGITVKGYVRLFMNLGLAQK